MGQPAQGAVSLFFWALAQDLTSTSGGKMTWTGGTSIGDPALHCNRGVKENVTQPLTV